MYGPWNISDEKIRDIVKTKLGCNEADVIIDNVSAPQTVCDHLGDCTNYADVQLRIEGICKGMFGGQSGIFRLYKNKLGNYSGEMIKVDERVD